MTQPQEALVSRRSRLLGAKSQLFYDEPVHLVRGEGVWLYDADGRKYLDAYNNVAHVGHCQPYVVEAGPKISSCAMRMPLVTLVNRVGPT